MALICLGESFSCCAEWLAGARSCPQGGCGRDACELEGEGPASDSGEEVALSVVSEVIGGYFDDGSGIYVSLGDEFLVDECLEPLRRFDVVFVVVVHFGNYIHVP